MTEDFYDLLDIPPDASQDEIKEAYREKVRVYHPDVNDDDRARAQFTAVKKAHEILGDPVERQAYDRLGHKDYVAKRTSGIPSPDVWSGSDSDGGDSDDSSASSIGGSTGGSSSRSRSGTSSKTSRTTASASASASGTGSTGSTGSTSKTASQTRSSAGRSTGSGTTGSGAETSTRTTNQSGTSTGTATGTEASASGSSARSQSASTSNSSAASASAGGTATSDGGTANRYAGAGSGTGTNAASETASTSTSTSTGGASGRNRLADNPLVRWWRRQNFALPLIWLSVLIYAVGLAHFAFENEGALAGLARELAAVGADPAGVWTLLASGRHGLETPAAFVTRVQPVAPPIEPFAWDLTLAGLVATAVAIVLVARLRRREDTLAPLTIDETIFIALALALSTTIVGGPLLAGATLMPFLFGVIVRRTRVGPGWKPSYLYVVPVLAPIAGIGAGLAGYGGLPAELLAFVALPLAGALGLPLRATIRKRFGR